MLLVSAYLMFVTPAPCRRTHDSCCAPSPLSLGAALGLRAGASPCEVRRNVLCCRKAKRHSAVRRVLCGGEEGNAQHPLFAPSIATVRVQCRLPMRSFANPARLTD